VLSCTLWLCQPSPTLRLRRVSQWARLLRCTAGMSYRPLLTVLSAMLLALFCCTSADPPAPGQLAAAGGPPADDEDATDDASILDATNDDAASDDDVAPCVLAGCHPPRCEERTAIADASCEAGEIDLCVARFGLCERDRTGRCGFRPSRALDACLDAGGSDGDGSRAEAGDRALGERCGPDDGACRADLYCRSPFGSCRIGGGTKCIARPTECDLAYAPVCGCDGVEYENECRASMAGVSVRSSGGCP
jgi:Kazal-type serine protease inhibitor domain